MTKRTLKIIYIFILLFCLIMVRRFETSLFYDPFLDFFHQIDFNHQKAPSFNPFLLFISLLFRYGLNSIFTLGIIQLWFTDKKITKISSYILVIGFIFFTFLYLISLLTNFGLGYMPTFYIRRILIQPILLLLLIPSIYYYSHLKKTNSQN